MKSDLEGKTFDHDPKYLNMRIGMNSRLDTIQAAVLIEKLKIFADEIEARNRVAARYAEGLGAARRTPCRTSPAGNVSNWAQYTIEHDDRDGLAAHLKAEGVPTAVYYPIPLHLQPAYDGYPRGPQGLPVDRAPDGAGHQPADALGSGRGDPGPHHRRRRQLQGLIRMTQHTPLKVGVAGAGVMGRNHARVLSELRDVELTTVFDPDAVTAEGVAAAYGATAVTTAQAFVAAGLDAAVIATPNRFHAELGVALLNAGVHVLVEKPIAATTADAQAMIDAAKANNRVLMVGHVERFNPAVDTVKRAIDGDEIISIQITRVGPFPPRMGEVGVVIDLAVHDIDIIRHLTGSEVVEVQSLLGHAHASREDFGPAAVPHGQ